MHLTGFNQAHTKDFCLRRVQIFQKWISSWFSECEHFAKILEVFFLPQRVQIWQKRTLSWILSYFFVQKYLKFPIFQTCFVRKQQFGGLFCRLGNLGGAMTPAPPPPRNGHAFNMYWWYRIVHVQQTLNYTNLTTAPKCKKPNLNNYLCMCAGVGVWVLLKSQFCVKHPIFTNISWDFDDLSTKTRYAPYNVLSSKHPPAGCTLDGNVIVTDQKIPSFWECPPPFPQNNWGPRCVLFPLLLCVGKFFFSPQQDKFFFFLPMWVKFFFLLCVGQVFFFFTFEWVKFFLLQKLPAPPPLEV